MDFRRMFFGAWRQRGAKPDWDSFQQRQVLRTTTLLFGIIFSNIFILLNSFSLPIYTGVICSGLNEVVVNFLANQRVPNPRSHSSSL